MESPRIQTPRSGVGDSAPDVKRGSSPCINDHQWVVTHQHPPTRTSRASNAPVVSDSDHLDDLTALDEVDEVGGERER